MHNLSFCLADIFRHFSSFHNIIVRPIITRGREVNICFFFFFLSENFFRRVEHFLYEKLLRPRSSIFDSSLIKLIYCILNSLKSRLILRLKNEHNINILYDEKSKNKTNRKKKFYYITLKVISTLTLGN